MRTFLLKAYNSIDRNALIFAVLFCTFLIFFEWFIFKVDYLSVFPAWRYNFLEFSANMIFVPLYFFIFTYISFASSRKYKIIYFVIFTFAILFEYSYQKAFGRFSDVTDVFTAFSTTTQQKFNAIFSYINLIALLPCIIFAVLLFKIDAKEKRLGIKSFLVVFLLIGIFYSSLIHFLPKFATHKYPMVSLFAFYRTDVQYAWASAFTYRGKREQVEQPQFNETYRPNNNIVLIIDESMRGDHYSLNGYSRQTTPYLEELQKQGVLFNWGIAASASTCSTSSYNLLLTGLTPDDVPDTTNKIKKIPTLFQYAKAMRYKTHYYDGQMNTYWSGTLEDLNYIDSLVNIDQIKKNTNVSWDYDFNIAKSVNEIISSSAGNFIVVFKRGNHPPYNDNFPSNATTWTPSIEGSRYVVPADQLPALVNSYDNAIKYNVDTFFKTLVSDYKNLPNNTIIVYTSDHGQTLGEDGINRSHCGNNYKEAIVPLFIIGNLVEKVDTNYKPIHANLFATVLDLMKFPETLRKHNYALSLLKAKASDTKERYFSDNSLTTNVKFDY